VVWEESEVLENLMLRMRNMDEMRDWEVSLKDYIERDWLNIVTSSVNI